MSAKYSSCLPLSMPLASYLSMRNHIQSASLLPCGHPYPALLHLGFARKKGFYPSRSAPIGHTAHPRYTNCLPAIDCLVPLTPPCLYCHYSVNRHTLPSLFVTWQSFFSLLQSAWSSFPFCCHSSVHAPSKSATSFSAANLMQAVYMQVPVDTLFQDNFSTAFLISCTNKVFPKILIKFLAPSLPLPNL